MAIKENLCVNEALHCMSCAYDSSTGRQLKTETLKARTTIAVTKKLTVSTLPTTNHMYSTTLQHEAV